MFKQVRLGLLLVFALPVWAQVEPAAVGGTPALADEDLRMPLPPPVSGASYPNLTGDEVRSNYLRAAVAFDAAYIDNAFAGEFSRPLHETTLTVSPTIALDRTTPRQRQTFSYSPGFTFYQPTSELNAIDQNANLAFEYRFAPYTALDLSDSFLQTTNLFGQSGSFYVGGVSGSAAGQILMVPFAEQISDTLHATFSHQYTRNQMFGADGFFTFLNFPNKAQSPGLYDSKSGGGSAFYTYRVGARHYVGLTYQYTHVVASPATGESNTSMQTVLPFYTVYLSRTVSISLAAGPQYFSATETGVPSSSGWTPIATASVGRQTPRTNVAVSYIRTVTGGGGLLGAYKQDSAALTGRAQVTRYWAVGLDSSYANVATATPGITIDSEGGHRISGRGLVQRTFSEHFGVELGYERLHQTYSGISLLARNPDSNRGYISLTYQFAKPIGR